MALLLRAARPWEQGGCRGTGFPAARFCRRARHTRARPLQQFSTPIPPLPPQILFMTAMRTFSTSSTRRSTLFRRPSPRRPRPPRRRRHLRAPSSAKQETPCRPSTLEGFHAFQCSSMRCQGPWISWTGARFRSEMGGLASSGALRGAPSTRIAGCFHFDTLNSL